MSHPWVSLSALKDCSRLSGPGGGSHQRWRDDSKNQTRVSEGGLGLGAERKIVPKSCFSLENHYHNKIRSRSGKPSQRKVGSWTFRGGKFEPKFDVNRACFPKEKHPNSQKRVTFTDFSFRPFFWFGLPGQLPIKFESVNYIVRYLCPERGQIATTEEKKGERDISGQFGTPPFQERKRAQRLTFFGD